LRHNIIVRLFEVARAKEAKGEALTEGGKLRTASYMVLAYWRDAKRNGKVISLNTELGDGTDCLLGKSHNRLCRI